MPSLGHYGSIGAVPEESISQFLEQYGRVIRGKVHNVNRCKCHNIPGVWRFASGLCEADFWTAGEKRRRR